MIKRLILSVLAVVLMAACTPGVQRVQPNFSGIVKVQGPYIELVSFKPWARTCGSTSCTIYTGTKLRVHNGLKQSFNIRTKCRYFVGDYKDSTITSKWFWLGAVQSVEMEEITNMISTSIYDGANPIKVKCIVEFKDEYYKKNYSQGSLTIKDMIYKID